MDATPVDVDEVDDIVETQPIDEVAQRTTENEAERGHDAGLVPTLPSVGPDQTDS